MDSNAFAILMAGGSGERFWPLSRAAHPKQLMPIPGGYTLLQRAVERLLPVFPKERILIVTSALYGRKIRDAFDLVPASNVIDEPAGRDTAAAIGLGTLVADFREPGARVLALPADHVVADVENYRRALRLGLERAESGALVTFGLRPTEPATKWGYLQRGKKLADGVYSVAKFHEKPDAARAAAYVASGDFYWNGGMFAATAAAMLEAIAKHLPDLATGLARLRAGLGKSDFPRLLAEIYPSLPKISIDYGVMEKAERVEVVELNAGLADVGTFEAFAAQFLAADAANNRLPEQALARGARDCIVVSQDAGHLVALDGVENLLIVHTPDATLVCRRDRADSLKDLLKLLREKGHGSHL